MIVHLRFGFAAVLLTHLLGAEACRAEAPDAYRAAWNAVRPKLDQNIRRWRQRDVTIEVVDALGKPLPGAAIDVRQTKHEFLFGCNILVLGQLGERSAEYEQAFVRLFNLATTTFCWSAVEPEPGRLRFAEGSEEVWRRPPPDRVVAFGKKHGLTLKGQPLLADSWHPAWAPKDPDEVRKAYRQWFQRVAERYGKDIRIWDVVNESHLCARRSPHFPLYTPELDYVGWAFQTAAPLFPAGDLLTINEATGVNGGGAGRYHDQVKKILDAGTRVDGIGFQFHLFSPATLRAHLQGKSFAPEDLLAAYGTFADLERPLFITEITVPTTLAEGPAGEAIQAEVLENLYLLWFSVPQMAGITYWNLPDGAAWKREGEARAGLLDEQLRPKPSYRVLDRLINCDWKTCLALKTDARGTARFRGFHGNYQLTVAFGPRRQVFQIDLAKAAPATHRLTVKP